MEGGEKNIGTDNPGVVAPPPLIYLSGLLVGGVISWFYPVAFLPQVVAIPVGGVLVVTGLVVVFVVRARMSKAETNIEPWKPTTTILIDGVYGVSRNPVYVGLTFMYVGIAFLFNLLWLVPPLVLVLIVMHYGVIAREEKYLERKFGDEYLSYKRDVRRWV